MWRAQAVERAAATGRVQGVVVMTVELVGVVAEACIACRFQTMHMSLDTMHVLELQPVQVDVNSQQIA